MMSARDRARHTTHWTTRAGDADLRTRSFLGRRHHRRRVGRGRRCSRTLRPRQVRRAVRGEETRRGIDEVCKSLVAGGVAGVCARSRRSTSRCSSGGEHHDRVQRRVDGADAHHEDRGNGRHVQGQRRQLHPHRPQLRVQVPRKDPRIVALARASPIPTRSSVPDPSHAGAGAGIFAMSATYPLDMVPGDSPRRWTASTNVHLHDPRGGVIVKEEGVLAVQGWLPSVIGVIPYVGLNFMMQHPGHRHG